MLEWVCPNCDYIFFQMPSKIVNNKSFCQRCNDKCSYGEKYISEFLNQLNEVYDKEKKFDWSDNRRYDFYLPLYSLIIEVHGKQHYCSSDFSYLGGRTYLEEQMNDEYKRELAMANGISWYVELKSSDSFDFVHNIMQSILPTILNFKYDDVDWELCHQQAIKSKTFEICNYYESTEKDINVLAQKFHCSYNTIRQHLKNGSLIGICSYSSIQSKKIGIRKSVDKMIAERAKPVVQINNKNHIIKEFPSIQAAQRELKISHIWDCLVGRRKTAGGYKWKYKEG